MKGVINVGIQEAFQSVHSADAWEEVKSAAGCDEPFFAIGQDYPDEITVALIKAIAEFCGLPSETVMVEYGKFMVPNTLKKYYLTYFGLAGSSAREFILSMDRVHEQATRSVEGALRPKFHYEELADGRLLVHYSSQRKLCSFLRGLILGVGVAFCQELQVREISCVHKGDPGCIMEVTFP
jgi:hypothetical protein